MALLCKVHKLCRVKLSSISHLIIKLDKQNFSTSTEAVTVTILHVSLLHR